MGFVDKWPSRMQRPKNYFSEVKRDGNIFPVRIGKLEYDGVMAWHSGLHAIQHEL